MADITRVQAYWFEYPIGKAASRELRIGDKLTIYFWSSRETWVILPEALTDPVRELEYQLYLENLEELYREIGACNDDCINALMLERARENAFPIRQTPPTPRLSCRAKMLQVSELTRSGFYAEVIY